jgi:hypothetical protein
VGVDFAMTKEITLSNKGRNKIEILVEPTADLIDLHANNIVKLMFQGEVSQIDLVLLPDEGLIQVFTNQEAEFLDYQTLQIED